MRSAARCCVFIGSWHETREGGAGDRVQEARPVARITHCASPPAANRDALRRCTRAFPFPSPSFPRFSMSVGILLVTHEGIASSLMAAARRVIRVMPLKVGIFEVPWEVRDGEMCTRTLRQELRDLDEGSGVLVLADIYGATPFNLTAEHEPGRTLLRVTGLNLPMLLRVLNYPEKNLQELAEVARDGGRAGVVIDG